MSSFGKFQVVGQMSRGGMAEIYLCRLTGMGGFDKEVVVKRIVPERSDDPDFVQMFLDEARVVSNLNHPNIVQVFEIGESDGLPYMAMEHVRGANLGVIIREATRQRKLHYGHAAYIGARVCEALHYAHNASSPEGDALGIVHRDVSPGNIVVSHQGIVKLLDFGVAKARGRIMETEAGTLKGKIRYMAPEQVSQAPLDQRADVFSLGVCLFELTTGGSPFGPKSTNEIGILRNIISGTIIKPSEIVPGYPSDLEEIILWAIELEVEKRCPSARVLGETLEAYLSTTGHSSSPRELSAWLQDLLPDFGAVTTRGSKVWLAGGTLGSRNTGPSGYSAVTESLGPGSSSGQYSGPRSYSRATGASPVTPPLRRGAWKGVAVAGGLVAVFVAAWLAFSRVPAPEVAVAPPPAPSAPPAADDETKMRAYLDAAEALALERRLDPAREMVKKAKDLVVASPALNIRLARVGDTVATAVLVRTATKSLEEHQWAAAMDAAKGALDLSPNETEALRVLAVARGATQPQLAVHTTPAPRGRERLGALSITTSPAGNVYVDDEPIGRSPISRRALSVGRHVVQVRAQGWKTTNTDIRVGNNETVALVLPLSPEPAAPAPPVARERPADNPAPAASTILKVVASPPPATAPPPGGDHALVPAGMVVAPPALARPVAAVAPNTPPAPPSSPAAPPPAALGSGSRVPRPTLPRTFVAKDAEQLAQMGQLVEANVVRAAGISPDFARGTTGALLRQVGFREEIYPVAMYYFLIREAALKHSSKTAAGNLASAHASGGILKLRDLPAIEPAH
jgi:serine/threonine protein kinase